MRYFPSRTVPESANRSAGNATRYAYHEPSALAPSKPQISVVSSTFVDPPSVDRFAVEQREEPRHQVVAHRVVTLDRPFDGPAAGVPALIGHREQRDVLRRVA